jgi:hypothetical protein
MEGEVVVVVRLLEGDEPVEELPQLVAPCRSTGASQGGAPWEGED